MSGLGGPFNPSGTGGLRPGTSLRPGSQMRPGTNHIQAAGIGGSLQQTIAVSAEAAVAKEGMRTSTRSGTGTSAGPGRQVGDRSYYIGLLRPKITELTAEIENLNEQERRIGENSTRQVELQRRMKTLGDEIAGLKGTLADINFAVENAASRDSKSVKEEAAKLEKQNADRRKEVDELFLSARDAETKMRANTQSLEEETAQLDKRILSENQDFSLYKSTRDEAYAVSDQVLERQHELRTLIAKQELLMANLANDEDKKQAAETLRGILRKRREKEELTKQCALSVEEEKQMLLKQVKATQADIEVLQRQVNDTIDSLQESKARIVAIDEEAKNYTGENVRAFQELQEKDQEMQRFIDEYPDREKEESTRIAEVQESISTLLVRISQGLEMQRQMPAEGSPSALQALNTEVSAKRDQIVSDQKTHERLEKELLDRKAELDKVASLDKKIKDELESHAARMEEQRVEIEKYSDLDALRQSVEKLRKELTAEMNYLVRVRDGGKAELNLMSSSYEAQQHQLEQNELYTSLATLEQKLRMLWQSTFALEDFVRIREKDSQYLSTKAECLRMVDEINLILTDPSRLTASNMSGTAHVISL